ncbi:gliding motility-associated C-terminal domain-containing protein [Paraflavitalea soli]|uniref:Gliding motility-associated C-terminal domain-containing protein n=1 Tax=Paraflavitalea soli TaxID=2315862 RepID=A0A3B7MHY3_9BACT|nr:gliding motility-associated C-terminal domain-containing protein [Paraflavitalea soli]AXY72790.1 gliding motility-associated C-terminal domain-containing protein [Paraflavitalea soli]
MSRLFLLTFLTIIIACLCQAQQAPLLQAPMVPPDECLPAFQKTYIAPGNHNVFYIHTTPDGGSVIGGNVNPVIADPNQQSPFIDAFIMKLNAAGSVEWAKRIGGNKYDEFRKIKPTSDGGYIAIGCTNSFTWRNSIYLVRLNAAGAIIWSKNFSSLGTYPDIGRDVIETADGGFAFTGTTQAALPFAKGLLVKTDANGNMIWGKEMYQYEGTDFQTVAEDGNTLAVGADYWASLEQKYYGSIIKFDQQTGNILSSLGFVSDERSTYGTQLFKTPTGWMAGLQLIDGSNFDTKQQGIITLDQNLVPASNQKLVRHDLNPWSSIAPTKDGGFVASAGRLAFGNSFFLYKVGSTGTFDWQKAYGNFSGIIMQVAANVQQYTNGTYISACTYYDPISGPDGKIHVIKVAPNGTTPGCRTDDETNTINHVPFRTAPLTWNNVSDFVNFTSPDVPSASTDLSFTVALQCASIPCKITGIDGNDSICIRTDTTSYLLQRNGQCVQPVTWTIDPAFAQITAATDSSVRIVFKKAGKVKLYAHILTPCEIVSDSLLITVFDNPAAVTLGPDIYLCDTTHHWLYANAGFVTYQWQDGSTDLSLKATTPGVYHVLATDHCGHNYRDTILLIQVSPAQVHLGKDTLICEGGFVPLTPGKGFASYLWQDGSGKQVFNAREAGIYWVQTTDQHGCNSQDSIKIATKFCRPSVTLPGAFSPNNDNRNDLFRPVVSGVLVQFSLIIYNRWGTKIFESTDARKGWDGTFNGQPQPSGSYIWTCYYKLNNSTPPVNKEKGIVILSR